MVEPVRLRRPGRIDRSSRPVAIRRSGCGGVGRPRGRGWAGSRLDGLAAKRRAWAGFGGWSRSSIRRSATSMAPGDLDAKPSRGDRTRFTAIAVARSEEWAGRWRSSASMTRAWPTPRARKVRRGVLSERCAGSGEIRCQRLLTGQVLCGGQGLPHAMRGRRHPAELHPLHAQDQRQGERFIQTLKRRWGLSRDLRDPGRLLPALKHYNHHRSKPGKDRPWQDSDRPGA